MTLPKKRVPKRKRRRSRPASQYMELKKLWDGWMDELEKPPVFIDWLKRMKR